ncbi:MAG: DUF1617 family protein [Clostridia bacterium]|nr:DUF1617 family protein [Clostridia bacterium]
MKLKTIVATKPALVRLTEKRFSDYKKLREIVKLRKSVESEFDFYVEQEKKAVEAYAEKKKDGTPVFLEDGRIKLKDPKSKDAFEAEIIRLQETEIDGITPITLSERDFLTPDDLPTASDMLALEGIIEFED